MMACYNTSLSWGAAFLGRNASLGILKWAGAPLTQQIRCASKKSGGSSRNKTGQTPGKHRGWKKVPGQYVEKGMILYRQLGLKVYPGENVGCGRDLTLFALEPGRVCISHEKLNPYPQSPLYPAVKAGRVVYKKFYNIIPEPQQQKFRLVSQT